MTPEEQLRNMATRLDELLELKSRSLCLDELYTFAIERLHYYREKNVGKTIPSLLDGFGDDGSSAKNFSTIPWNDSMLYSAITSIPA